MIKSHPKGPILTDLLIMESHDHTPLKTPPSAASTWRWAGSMGGPVGVQIGRVQQCPCLLLLHSDRWYYMHYLARANAPLWKVTCIHFFYIFCFDILVVHLYFFPLFWGDNFLSYFMFSYFFLTFTYWNTLYEPMYTHYIFICTILHNFAIYSCT